MPVKLKQPFWAYLVLLFTLTTAFIPHGTETPHGGVVVHANEGYNVEKVYRIKKKISFYLLEHDEIATVSDNTLSGEVEFLLKNGTIITKKLILHKDNEDLYVILQERKEVKRIIVKINYQNKIIKAIFK